jgi:hypothetical protein
MKITLKGAEAAIECDAKEALAWLTKEGVKVDKNGPRALAGLGVLIGAAEQFLADAEAGNLIGAVQQIKPVIGDVKTFVADLGIKD